jgi:hypothetical protein
MLKVVFLLIGAEEILTLTVTIEKPDKVQQD